MPLGKAYQRYSRKYERHTATGRFRLPIVDKKQHTKQTKDPPGPRETTNNLHQNKENVFTQLFRRYFEGKIVKHSMKRFAKTVVNVLIAYADIVRKDFPNYVTQ